MRAGMFAIPLVLWGKIFLSYFQSDGHSIPTSTTPFTLTSSHQPEAYKEDPVKNNNDPDRQYIPNHIFVYVFVQ
jgi:hypothetical protein